MTTSGDHSKNSSSTAADCCQPLNVAAALKPSARDEPLKIDDERCSSPPSVDYRSSKQEQLAKSLLQGGHKRKLDENLIDFLSEDELLGSSQQLSSTGCGDFDDEDAHLKPSKHAKISTSVETIDSNESLVIGNSSSTNCPGSNNSSFGLEEKCTISSSVYEDDVSKQQLTMPMVAGTAGGVSRQQPPPTFLTILPSKPLPSTLRTSTSQERLSASPSNLSPTFPATTGTGAKSTGGQSPPVIADNSGLDYFTLLLSYKSTSDRDSPPTTTTTTTPSASKNILIDGVGENVYTFLRYRREEMLNKSISTFIQPADLSKFVNLFTATSSATTGTSSSGSACGAASTTFHATAPFKHENSSTHTGSPSSPSPNSNNSNSKQHRTFTCHMLSKQLLSPTLSSPSSSSSSQNSSFGDMDSGKPAPNALSANKSLKPTEPSNPALLPSPLPSSPPQYELMTITAGQTTVSSNDKKETVLCLVQMNKAQSQTLQIPHPISIKTPPLPQIYQATTTTSITSPAGATGSSLTSPTGMTVLPPPPQAPSNSNGNYDCNMDVIITKMTKRGLVLWIDVASLNNMSFINNIPNGVDGIRSGLLYNVIKLGKMADIHEFVHNNDIVHVNKHISDGKSPVLLPVCRQEP